MRLPWPHHVPPQMLIVLLVMVVVYVVTWDLMNLAEKRWNRDTPRKRRLSR